MLIIKNMDMPKNCNYCRFNYDGLCHAARKSLRESHAYIGGRLEDCPLESFSWCRENDSTDIDADQKWEKETVRYCDKWPNDCIVCELELCDGKKETAEKNLELEANNILRKMLGIEPKEG